MKRMLKLSLVPLLFSCAAYVNADNQFDLIEKSSNLLKQQQYIKAIPVLEKLTKLNPVNGRYWYQLADSHYEANHNQLAIDAFKKAAELGYQRAFSSYNIAATYGRMGDVENSVKWLTKTRISKMSEVEQRLLSDKDFDPVRTAKLFQQQIFPKLPDGSSRVEKWQTDLAFFSKRMQQTHYQLFSHFDQAFWDKSIDALKNEVSTLADHQIYLRMVKLVALLKDGHSFVIPPFGGLMHFHTVPLRFANFSDGLYVHSAAPQYQALVGKKLTAINGKPIKQVLETIKPLFYGDNEPGAQWVRKRWLLNIPEILQALNVTSSMTDIPLTVTAANGQQTAITVKGEPLNPSQFNLVEQPDHWITMSPQGETRPLWQQRGETNFWFKHLAQPNLVYFKYNKVRNSKDQRLSVFVELVMDKVKQTKAKALVIDLRSNSGGNGYLNKVVVHALLKSEINQSGRLFVLTSNKTFSAAHQLALQIEFHTKAIFVGQPTGSKAIYRGESNMVMLPNTGMMVTVASRQFQQDLSDDYRTALAPDVLVTTSGAQFAAGVDPVLNAVIDSVQ